MSKKDLLDTGFASIDGFAARSCESLGQEKASVAIDGHFGSGSHRCLARQTGMVNWSRFAHRRIVTGTDADILIESRRDPEPAPLIAG